MVICTLNKEELIPCVLYKCPQVKAEVTGLMRTYQVPNTSFATLRSPLKNIFSHGR